MAEKRGSIAFFSTYRPPIPLNLYARPFIPNPPANDYLLIDKKSYNYNGREIPKNVLKTLLKNTTKVSGYFTEEDVENGHVSGLVFVSERYNNLETLHFAFRIIRPGFIEYDVKVISFAHLYNRKMEVCMEDSGCFAGDRYFIFVSTHERNEQRRQPWTAVYRTDLITGETTRLTREGVSDFSPSVSPSGNKIAVATLQEKVGGWTGEIENLETDIAVMDVDDPTNRKIVINNAGWPSWGGDNVLFTHRSEQKGGETDTIVTYKWGVYRTIFGDDFNTIQEDMITPMDSSAMTPAAIDTNLVAVSIIRDTSPPLDTDDDDTKANKFRHIELFDCSDIRNIRNMPITRNTSQAFADHFNPFIIRNFNSLETLIGYSRLDGVSPEPGEVVNRFEAIQGDDPEEVGVVRVPGVFPTFTKKGDKLAFVDNDFRNVHLVDTSAGVLSKIFSVDDLKLGKDVGVFSPIWNQNEDKDILYVCVGPAFNPKRRLDIYTIFNTSNDDDTWQYKLLTNDGSNNAFPFTNPDGTKLVFRSTRDWIHKEYDNPAKMPKNLYIMHDLDKGDKGEVTRLTEGEWVDTHCQWSPNGDWIVFSSTRDKPDQVLDNGLDLGYFAVYLTKASDTVMNPVRVIRSGDLGAGHVNHPMFSPDGLGLVFTSDLAGVSVEPISLPLFIHSVRPYGDIFRVDLRDTENIDANQDIKEYTRVTHSRYENSTPNWACIKTGDLNDEKWKALMIQFKELAWKIIFPEISCPMTRKARALLAGQLGIEKRYC